MKNIPHVLAVIGMVLQLFVFSNCIASAEETATGSKRFRYGDWTLLFNQSSLGSIQWRDQTLIKSIYCYTSIKSSNGSPKAGFNFRDLDGNLRLVKEKLGSKIRLTWKNKRYVYDQRNIHKTNQLAGEMMAQLILEKNRISLEYTGKIEPNHGFGEIGFFIPEKSILNHGQTKLTLERTNGEKIDKVLFSGSKHIKSISYVNHLDFLNNATHIQFNFEGQLFKGSHGVFFQDFRHSDTPNQTGCYRVVLGFSTRKGNELKYKWIFDLTPADEAETKK